MAISPLALAHMEDRFVDSLLMQATTDVPLFAARYSRAVLDLNRAADEFDPDMFVGAAPVPPRVTSRVRQGLGVIPRLCGNDQPIYAARLPVSVLVRRIREIHTPWHRAIEAAMDRMITRHGRAVLLDVHSMPSLRGKDAPVAVVGDRFGHSAARWMGDMVLDAFGREGLKAVRNLPYAGGFTTICHGKPRARRHVLQIEIDRGLYMNQTTLVPNDRFGDTATALARVIGRLADALASPGALAAE